MYGGFFSVARLQADKESNGSFRLKAVNKNQFISHFKLNN